MAIRRQHIHTRRRFRLRRLWARRPAKTVPVLLTTAGALCIFAAGTVLWWSKDLPDPQSIQDTQGTESTKIYDSTGTHLLYEIGDVRRTHVPLDAMSRFVVQATLAVEDDQFYSHNGLDFAGIARGTILKPLTGQRAQGGSTITQQLIKNSLLTPERTVQRKVKEAVLAVELEQRFSKDEILEMYLNTIPYGSRAYGVEAASQTFFGAHAQDLTLAQASILAALPKAPTYYSPYGSHMEDLKARQKHILARMVELDIVTQDQADEALATELTFAPPNENIQAPHFVFYVIERLQEEYGERVVDEGGLHVITTLDARLQSIAEEVLQDAASTLDGLGASNGALVAVDPKNGNILAMAGSLDYFNEDIDGNVNVAIRHRSPGSSIKPFTYAVAFQEGFTPETTLVDAETDFGQGYKPLNYNLDERGPVSMRFALANSLNIPAVKTLYLAGVRNVTDLAQDMGMTSLNDPDRYGLSLVLGGGEVRLLDITSAYGVFAVEGVKYETRAIQKVEHAGEVLFDTEEEEIQGEEVLDPQIARVVTNVLSDNGARAATFGSRSHLQLGSRPVAAKTGTSQDFRDGWTLGFTPSLAAGAWVGNNDNTPMQDKSGGISTAAPIWNSFMRRALEGAPIEQFTRPEPAQDIQNNALRGVLPEVKGKWIPETEELFTLDCPIQQGEPRTFKELHNILFYVRRTNPNGPPPETAENDPQFVKWEEGVAIWREKHNEDAKANPEGVFYTDSLPTPSCNIGDEENIPTVRITEPNTSTLSDSPVTVRAEVESEQDIKEVRFLFDKEVIKTQEKSETYEATLSFDESFTGRKVLQILAITEDGLLGSAQRTFAINPDDSPPTVTLHTPQDGANYVPSGFPLTVKITATDDSGIELVDVLYEKEGVSGARRIGRTSELAPTAPNRYEVVWGDSPGPGNYNVYTIVYDITGNFTQTQKHTITVE